MITRQDKLQMINTIRDEFSSAKFCSVISYTGLSVASLEVFRRALYAADSTFRATKKTLLAIATQNSSLSNLTNALLPGQVGMVCSNAEPFKVLKILFKSTITVLCGTIDGGLLNEHDLKQLSKISSISELYAKIVGSLLSPITKLALFLKVCMYKIMYFLKEVKCQTR